MKKIGFLSFGHYRDVPGSLVRTAQETLHNTVDLAVAAEEIGFDGAWLRVHHFGRSLATPMPTLATIGAKTTTIELGTGVIDMRYENPAHLAEEAGIADLFSGGRLQLGIGRGTPPAAVDALALFGSDLGPEEDSTTEARARTELFRRAIAGEPIAHSRSLASPADLRIEPRSPGLPDRIWWGSASPSSSRWAGEQGMNILSSSIMLADDGRPFHVQQADQFRSYRDAYATSGTSTGGNVAVLRSVFPITTDEDRQLFGSRGDGRDGVGVMQGRSARTGPDYVGAPDELVHQLEQDEALAEADYVLFALPNQLGLDYNTRLMGTLYEVARLSGWK